MYHGRILVKTHIMGYRKIHKLSQKVLDTVQAPVPPLERATYACWIELPEWLTLRVDEHNEKVRNQQISTQRDVLTLVDDVEENNSPNVTELEEHSTIKMETEEEQNTNPENQNSKADIIDITAGTHAISHAIIALIPLYIMCDANREVMTECAYDFDQHSLPNKPIEVSTQKLKYLRPHRILLYENFPGMALAKSAITQLESLAVKALSVFRSCDCDDGCPSCCQSTACREHNLVMSKKAAIWILDALLVESILYSLPDQ
jgi:ATP-dependent helicase YprA (DUF1998 family)